MAKREKQKWAVGDVFLVETVDGLAAVGQIVGQEKSVLNSVSCAFFDVRINAAHEVTAISDLDASQIFSVLFVTKDLLDEGVWRVVGNRPVDILVWQKPYEQLRKNDWVGAKVIGSNIVTEFINAFYALVPWDDWKNPAYLDQLLVSPGKKPKQLLFRQ